MGKRRGRKGGKGSGFTVQKYQISKSQIFYSSDDEGFSRRSDREYNRGYSGANLFLRANLKHLVALKDPSFQKRTVADVVKAREAFLFSVFLPCCSYFLRCFSRMAIGSPCRRHAAGAA